MALAQDADGVLWIGTLDGAATFDGKSIEPVADVPGAPLRGVIGSIVARRAGGVYVGSPTGVHVFDGKSWRLLATSRGVAALAESLDGGVWISHADGALYTLQGKDAWQRRDEMKEPAADLSSAPDGAVWAATETGAVRLFRGKAEPIEGPPLPSRPGALLAARDGRVWVATQGGTVHWARHGEPGWHQAAFPSWPRGAFRCLAEDRRGRIWAGSYGGGLAFGTADGPWRVWNSANGPFEPGVMSVLGDREGSVWFGLNAVGLAQWVGEEWSHRTMVDPWNPNGRLFSAFGLSRTAAPHGLLVSAFQHQVLRLGDGPSRSYGPADGLTEDVRAAVEPEPGTLFAGARFGLFESRAGEGFRRVLTVPSGFIMGLYRSPDGTWYAASSMKGVFLRGADGWQPAAAINAGLDNLHVRGMTWMRNGELWVATLRGISIFRDGAAPRRLTAKQEPALPDSVNAVLEVSDDEVWAAGTGGIAVRRGGAWRRMTEADGIPGQTAYSLAKAPDGTVWVGGSGGVGRYRNGRWTVWDSRSGLLQEECNLNGLVVDDDGSVYVGTMGGLARFDPTVTSLPPPALKLIWKKAPERDAAGVARLASGERALHLRWSAAWLDPRPVQYRVRVPRLRDSWSETTFDDHLDIENLGAGKWAVSVAARVEGTDAWTAPLDLELIVAPYWHETLAARAGFAALLAAAGFLAVRLRVRVLRRHAAALEKTVRERTAELAEKVELLQDSEQRALAASRAKSSFLANMSHELRTPLNGVLGFAQLLARRPGRDIEDREGLAVILKSGEHLLGLINDVLSLSKIEAGRVTLEEAPFDLRAAVRDVEDVLRLRAEAKDLRLVCEIDEARLPRAVHGDEGRLRQILLNLLGNAVKFTAHGSVTLRVRWKDGRGLFEVEDTGEGIAAGEMAGLFEPFVQTESGRRTKEGTGLGLALSRDLARLMCGDITATSVPGQGTSFRVEVSLPEATAESLAKAPDRRRVVALAPGQSDLRVLVVDDVPLNRTVLSRLLTSVGFEVREAAGGEEALATWRSWAPKLIWMDKRMPGLDGLEVTRRIRAEERARGQGRVPILALSASALEHERGEILAAGCDDFVAKPFLEATIFAKLREHLGVSYVYDAGDRRRPTTTPEGAAPEPAAESARSGAGRVLLVDDDWICREVAQELLRGRGFTVTTSSSGREALAILEASTFDLVLLDIQMPDMTGVEVARRIRANPETQGLPLIAMTADSFEGEGERFRETGMDDHIGKPIEPAALEEILLRWLPRPPGA